MKKCKKNLLLVLEFIVLLFAMFIITPLAYYSNILPESIKNLLTQHGDLIRYIIPAIVMLLIAFFAVIVRRDAFKRKGEVAFPYQKAVIFPLGTYVFTNCLYLSYFVWFSRIGTENVAKYTVYGLLAGFLIVAIFYGLLGRIIFRKDKRFLPFFFTALLLVMMVAINIVAFENNEYFNQTSTSSRYFPFAIAFVFIVSVINYLVIVFGLNKECKLDYQEKEVMEVISENKEEAVEEKAEEVAPEAEEQPQEEPVQKAEPAQAEAAQEEKVEETQEEAVEAEEKAEEVAPEAEPVLEEAQEEVAAQEAEPVVVAEEKPETPAVPKAPKERKVIKPTPQALLKFMQANFEDIVILVDPDGVSFKASRKKKVFISLKVAANDYRIVFQRKPISITRLIVKYPSITKAKSPAGDQWFKLVNKGEFTEVDLHNIIKGSYAYLVDEEAKAALKKQKEKEKAALKKQKEKEKEAEKRKKEREKAKLAEKKNS